MAGLFDPYTIRGVTFRNRIFVSPMCQYSSRNGLPTDWHLVHLGSRAVGGAGLVMVEATAISPEGRISASDSGLWSDTHAEAFERITNFIYAAGAIPGVQLAHAGRKAATEAPWMGGGPMGSDDPRRWRPVATSPVPFREGDEPPQPLDAAGLDAIAEQFRAATRRALEAGFRALEIHMAHGYLLHEFLSPLSNRRDDAYGGDLEGRMRFPLRVAESVRRAWPEELPLFVRLSATDWVEGGWDLDQSVAFAARLGGLGVDLVDCSSGGLVPGQKPEAGPGYQVQFARAIRERASVGTAAVGSITTPAQAEEIVRTGSADAVILARALLRDPYWPLHAAEVLETDVPWPAQYLRARPTPATRV